MCEALISMVALKNQLETEYNTVNDFSLLYCL